MRNEHARAKPPELPKRRGKKKTEESPVEMEGLRDVSELAAETGDNDNAEAANREEHEARMNETSAALSKKIEDMTKQKEVNLRNPALSEAMAEKINAEIDKNVADLRERIAAKPEKKGRGKSSRAKDMAERVDERMSVDEESEAALAKFREDLEKKREGTKDDDADIVTSAPKLDKLISKGPKAPKAPLGPRKKGEAARTYEESREDLEKAFEMLEKSAEKPKEVDIDLTELNEQAEQRDTIVDADMESRMKKEGGDDIEQEFFKRSEQISAAHEAGEELEATETERAGQRKQDRFEGRSKDQELLYERKDLLEREIPGIQNAVTAAERRLNREFGISDADAVLQARAESVWESAKGFFGGLFSKKEKMKNAALEDYQRLRDRLTDRQSELQETNNRLTRPEDIRRAQQIKGERRRP